MSAYQTASIAASATPDIIVGDLSCIGCGYSLNGLKVGGVCPECGRPIKGKKRAPRYTDQLVHAPMTWLEIFATGTVLLFISAVGMIAMIVTLLFARNTAVLLVFLGITCAWTLGVWMCTRPRPVMPTTTVNVHAEWRALRLTARLSQLFWPLTALLVLFSIWVYNNSLTPAALYGAIACAGLSLLVAVGGVAPTCALLAHLADWAEDSSLAQGLRGCAWTVCFCGLVIALAVFNGYTGLLGSVIGATLAVFIIGLVFMPPGYFLVCLFRLQSMARWAVWNHVAAEAKLDRFKSRAESAARRSSGSGSPRHIPPADR